MRTLFLTLVILAGMASSLNAQQRPIDWVHGLNDSQQFWQNERALFEAERAGINAGASTNANYAVNAGTRQGVGVFANRVAAQTNNGGVSLAIGHSMGGLAIRELVRQDALRYRGMIACGSPLRGAKIMNSFQNGTLEQALSYGGWQMVRGPLAQLGYAAYFVAGVAADAFIPRLRQIYRDNFTAEYGEQTIIDLAENSGYMNDIRTFSSSTPRVYIWGNENSPIHWRLLSSTLRHNNNQGWQNGEDQEWADIARNFADVYEANAITNAAASVAAAIALNPSAVYFAWVSLEWKAGRDYIRTTSESDWANVIGAESGYVYNTSTYVTNVCTNEYYYGTCGQYQDPQVRQACQNNCFQTVSYTYTFAVQSGSDGLVAGYSQRSDATQWQVPSQDQYEAVSVNHIEMRGHDNMTARLRDVFNRNDVFRIQ